MRNFKLPQAFYLGVAWSCFHFRVKWMRLDRFNRQQQQEQQGEYILELELIIVSRINQVNVPKTRRTYCKSKACHKHTQHKVTQYKAGKVGYSPLL